jgi:hypothetical protein
MSLNPTQGMDVRCVYVYSVFVLSCVSVAALRRVDHWISGLRPEWAGKATVKKCYIASVHDQQHFKTRYHNYYLRCQSSWSNIPAQIPRGEGLAYGIYFSANSRLLSFLHTGRNRWKIIDPLHLVKLVIFGAEVIKKYQFLPHFYPIISHILSQNNVGEYDTNRSQNQVPLRYEARSAMLPVT